MSKVLTTLDCGCAIMDNGHRAMCPTCEAGPRPDHGRELALRLVSDRIESAEKIVDAVRQHLDHDDSGLGSWSVEHDVHCRWLRKRCDCGLLGTLDKLRDACTDLGEARKQIAVIVKASQ
jgi:hypothetical protein